MNWSKSYVYAGSRLLSTITKSGSSELTEYHHPDRLGTKLVTDSTANTAKSQSTLPFGALISAETQATTNQKFTLYDRSGVTGLDYAVNRTYNSGQSRFTQVDPIGIGASSIGDPQSLNMFAYTQNDPVDFVDPTGENLQGPYDPFGIAYYVDGILTTANHAWGILNSGSGFINFHNVAGLEVVESVVHYENVRVVFNQSFHYQGRGDDLDKIYGTPACDVSSYDELNKNQKSLIGSNAFSNLSQLQKAVFVNITGALLKAGASFLGLGLSSVESDRILFKAGTTGNFQKSIRAGTKSKPKRFNKTSLLERIFNRGHKGMRKFVTRQNVAANSLQVGFGKKGAFADIDLWNPQKEFGKHQKEVRYNRRNKAKTPHFYLAKKLGNCK